MSTSSLAYGPNTAAVRRFLQRLAALPPGEWARATERYAALQRDPAFDRADMSLAREMAASGRDEARRAVVGPTLQLAASAHEDLVARASPGERFPDMDMLAECAWAAVLAMLLRDRLDAADLAILYGPFASVIPAGQL